MLRTSSGKFLLLLVLKGFYDISFREFEGTLLPLWKFGFEKARKLEITALCWTYNDLFAAGFGSCNMTRMTARTDNDSLVADNFYEQTEPGVVCVFSLKNPSYPEFLCQAPCGVMCLDFHPEVGLLPSFHQDFSSPTEVLSHCSTPTCWWLDCTMAILLSTIYRRMSGSQTTSRTPRMENTEILSGRYEH